MTNERARKEWPDRANRIEDLVMAIDWIAVLFSAPPAPEFVLALQNDESGMAFEALSELSGSPSAVSAIHTALFGKKCDFVERSLASAYSRLFDGVGGPETVVLCESAYTGAVPRLYQQASDDMRQLLASMSLSTASSFREPPDHLSLELGLLAYSIRLGRTADARVLLEKLLDWVPRVAARLDGVDTTGFYKGAARVLVALLERVDEASRRASVCYGENI